VIGGSPYDPAIMSTKPGVTVVGNLSVDHVDDRPASPGGCPAFAAFTLQTIGAAGRVLTKCSPEDRPLFDALLSGPGVPVEIWEASRTSAFSLRYLDPEHRTMHVDAVGDPWELPGLAAAGIETTWIHAGPLLRNEFPPATLAGLVAAGHRISFDGQGLVRVPRVGPLEVDGGYDPAVVAHLSVLKLDAVEANVVAGGVFDGHTAARLGVPEVLVTFGSGGSDVYVDGNVTHVPAAARIADVQTTGTGDTFTVAYVAARSCGSSPLDAAGAASELVARMLEHRRAGT
jgi:sugar/nucleoside kinase (ribokinase family)